MRVTYNSNTGLWETYVGDVKTVDTGTDSGNSPSIREVLKQKYGWMTPSEFYNLSDEQKASAQGKITNIILDLNQNDIGTTDNDPKDYVWINTLSNWCYIKFEQDAGDLSVKTWLGAAVDAVIDFASDVWDKVSDAYMSVIDVIKNFDWSNPWEYITMPWKLIGATWIAEAMTAVGIAASVCGTIFVFAGTSIKAAICGLPVITDIAESGIDDEPRADTASKFPEICAVTYVWDGYRKRWMSLKKLVWYWKKYFHDSYSSICERTVLISFQNEGCELLTNNPIRGEQVTWQEKVRLWCLGAGVSEQEVGGRYDSDGSIIVEYNIIDHVVDLFEQFKSGRQFNGDFNECRKAVASALSFSKELFKVAREYMRIRFQEETGIDPISFGEIYIQSPCEKHVRWGGNNFDNQTWSQWTIHEIWGMYVPLHQDDCRLTYMDNTTAQTMIRANNYQKHLVRDRYLIDTIWCGTPVLSRFSDGRMWLALWLRWSGNGFTDVDKAWDAHSTSMSSQWGNDDLSLHSQVMHQMFQKHDDYGFDEWCINSNYGLEYKYFTVNEEVATNVTSKEDSHLINTKTDIVTTQFDDSSTAKIKFTIQTPTVERSKNDLMTTVEKWK